MLLTKNAQLLFILYDNKDPSLKIISNLMDTDQSSTIRRLKNLSAGGLIIIVDVNNNNYGRKYKLSAVGIKLVSSMIHVFRIEYTLPNPYSRSK